MRSTVSTLLLCAACLLAQAPRAVALDGHIGLEGAELVLRLDDGRSLRREALVGLTLTLASPQGEAEVRIDGYDEDISSSNGEKLPLYRMSYLDTASRERRDLCQPDADGGRVAFAFPDGAGGFKLTCTSGSEGKCVVYGYFPWEKRDGVPMKELHQACVNMLRADYGGDDRPTARSGTPVNLYDRFGIHPFEPAPGMEFEAAWGPDGAICVAHPRVADNTTLEELAERYPRLKGHLGPRLCDSHSLRSDPRALLFNDSILTWRSPK